MINFSENLKVLRKALRSWNWTIFGDLNRKVEKATQKVDGADSDIMGGWSEERESRLIEAQADLARHLRSNYKLMEEKSQLHWISGGEKNSVIFHIAMKVHRAQSRCSIELRNGTWSDDRQVIGTKAAKVYEDLLVPVTSPVDEEVLSVVLEILTQSENNSLMVIPLLEEIWEVVWSMEAKSAPGLDGFTIVFYQACWDVIASDLLAAVTWFF